MTCEEGSDETFKVFESRSTPKSKTELEKKDDDDFEQRLASLPQQCREEILRQYDLPTFKVTLFSMLGFATWVEVILMIVGSMLSIGAGTNRL